MNIKKYFDSDQELQELWEGSNPPEELFALDDLHVPAIVRNRAQLIAQEKKVFTAVPLGRTVQSWRFSAGLVAVVLSLILFVVPRGGERAINSSELSEEELLDLVDVPLLLGVESWIDYDSAFYSDFLP